MSNGNDMRTIKFRVWHHTLNKFIPADEWYLDLNGRLCFLDIKGITDDYLIEVEENLYTAQQYTGLKDMNGKEIYEGDIIKTPLAHMFRSNIYEVKYHQNRFTPDDICDGDVEIIGNIFENKDLLK